MQGKHSTFAMLVQGRGTGCDYTIACNKDFEIFEEDSWEEAIARCQDYYEEHGGSEKIDSIVLLAAESQREVDFDEDGVVEDEPMNDLKELAKRLKQFELMEQAHHKLRMEHAKATALVAEVLSAVKELSGQDPVEVANESNGKLADVARNLFFDAVRLKAAQMRAKEKA